MTHDIFISYSSKNLKTALAICHVLEDNKIRCWMAPRDIPAGTDYGDIIEQAICDCTVFLLIFSEPATISRWVRGELNLAFDEQKHIIPYRIDKTPLKGALRVILNQMHWIDAHPNADDEFEPLLQSIVQTIGISTAKDNRDRNYSDKKSETSVKNTESVKILSDADCILTIDDNAKRTIKIERQKIMRIQLKPGAYMFKFDSTHFKDTFIEVKVVINKEIEDLIEVKLISEINKCDFYIRNVNNKYGYVNRQGKDVIPLKYDYAGKFCCDLALARNGKHYFYINKVGSKVIDIDGFDGSDFSENLALVSTYHLDYNKKKYGYIDKKGTFVIPVEFNDALCFSEGIAAVMIGDKWGYIDKTGKEILPFSFQQAKNFRDGVAPVCINDKWGAIDKSGKILINLQYDYMDTFNDGIAIFYNKVSEYRCLYGYIDNKGSEIFSAQFNYVYPFSEGLAAIVTEESKVGFINKRGEYIIPPIYDSDHMCYSNDGYRFKDGLAGVCLNGLWGFIDTDGEVAIPFKYEHIDNFDNEMGSVYIKGNWRPINKNGKVY